MRFMKKLNIVIMAAGKGTRMKSDLPKVAHLLAGKALAAHVVDVVAQLSEVPPVVVVGYRMEVVKAALGIRAARFAEQHEQLGTGHAVMQAAPHLDDSLPTLVLNGDVPLIRATTLDRLLAAAGTTRLGLLTAVVPDASGYGRVQRDAGGQVRAIIEHKDASAEERKINEYYTGTMLVPPGKLKGWLAQLSSANAQREYYLTDLVKLAVADGVDVIATHPDHIWEAEGINDRVQLAAQERACQLETARGLQEAGVTIIDPARLDVRGTLECASDVEIDIGCVFTGNVYLGAGVRVGAYCMLNNVTLGAGTEVLPYSHLDGAQVGTNGRIGPYARLRPGSVLANDVHIGNFVEVKNATIANNSKANHLSYVGDATVGSRVNIGAGTITCNYDGANKHRTIIEDDVFIGSDTQLVAPVTVRRGATLGAGTTLTKDAPEDSLTISRAKQVSLANYKRPVKSK